MDEAILAKMRADFERMTEHRLREGGWSTADVQELGDVIKAAIDKGNQDTIQGWARWLSDRSADIAALILERQRKEWHAERCREVAYWHDESNLREINRAWVQARMKGKE